MRILWIVNIVLPDIAEYVGLPKLNVGGWMRALASDLSSVDTVSLAILTIYRGKDLKKINIGRICYYLLPVSDYKSENIWKNIDLDFSPDIVHIHGTECDYGIQYIKYISSNKSVISIQGLVSVYERYYLAGIDFDDIIRNMTLADVFFKKGILQGQFVFRKKAKLEIEYMSLNKHIIGRTEWDKVHVKTIAPNSIYHFCNESLRDSFYTTKWDFRKVTKFTIFLTQASYPIKGLHFVLKAVSILKSTFPSIKIFVGGPNIISKTNFRRRILFSGYGNYIKKQIRLLGLENNIEFLGDLTEVQVAEQMAVSHVFVCPSSVENSPNSLGEAQLVGLPCIGSYVGGIPDMIEHNVTGYLYRFEEYEMLAYYLRKVFENENIAKEMSIRAQNAAQLRHSKKENLRNMLDIYSRVMGHKII